VFDAEKKIAVLERQKTAKGEKLKTKQRNTTIKPN
jgi:hypothetical protein